MASGEESKAEPHREIRSFLMARDPSIDRRFRPAPTSKLRLFNNVEEEDSSESASDYYGDDDASATETDDTPKTMSNDIDCESGALVYLRMRPVTNPSSTYNISDDGNVLIIKSLQSTSTSNNKCNMEKQYSFSEIFGSGVLQSNMYEKCIIQKVENEEDFTVLTYGTSGSGKTFTLLGNDNAPGIIPRSLEHIFTIYAGNIYPHPSLKLINGRLTIMEDEASVKETRLRSQILNACGSESHSDHVRLQQNIRDDHTFVTKSLADVSVFIWVSFVELYNEFVYDLLTLPAPAASQTMAPPTQRKNLKIVCNDGQVFIKGLTSVYVKTSSEALRLLSYGLQRVNYASTAVNVNSSRSHCIFFVHVLKFFRSGLTTQTSYKFCDLAGSERLTKTGNVGSRLKEAQRINTSLLVLGRCLDAANNNRKINKDVIPFRESKLTLLLQGALLGKEKLTMIVNVTPTDKYYEENLNVLSFASIAKNIKFKKPVVKHNNSRYSVLLGDQMNARNEYVEQLLEENIFLRGEMERTMMDMDTLKGQHEVDLLKQEQELRKRLCDQFQTTIAEIKQQHEMRLQFELGNQKRLHEAEIAHLKRKYAEELEDLRDEYEENKENSFVEDNGTL